jgi:sec-independent protein translocase protein TatC
MGFLDEMMEHFDEMKSRAIKIVICLVSLMIFFFSFTIKTVSLLGVKIAYPFPAIEDSIANIVIAKMINDFVPTQVVPIVTKPIDAMFVQMRISLFLAIVFGSVYILYQIATFVFPALTESEKKLIYVVTLPSASLFIAGVLFAYYFIIPFTIDYLYSYAAFITRLEPLLTLPEFIAFVVMLLVAFGIVFTLPVYMVGLSAIGLVSSKTWFKNWRYVVVFVLIFSAIITPDGSGVTQLFVTVPIMGLYFLGAYISRFVE